MVELLADAGEVSSRAEARWILQFGYAEAKITVAILKKAYDSGDLTRDGLFKAFDQLQQVDLGWPISASHLWQFTRSARANPRQHDLCD